MTSGLSPASGAPASGAAPTLAEAARVWWRIGILSFGGPAAQIALMHRMVVDERRWLTERQYLDALSFCMLLPGPEAMQLATYAGWRMHGVRGGLIAGGLFVLPGAVVIACLAALYVRFGALPVTAALFMGVKAAVLVIVIEALLRVARRALIGTEALVIAALAFVALFVFAVPYPLVIAAAAIWGALRLRDGETRPRPAAASPGGGPARPVRATIRTAATWLALWAAPLLAVAAIAPPVFGEMARFFSVLATVTFGGAYAVLAYMTQEAVATQGWLTTGEMLDALGLAETTPGPLILVTEFVGFLAGHRAAPAGGGALLWGLGGALVTLWATFAPCFLWIFAGAPWIDAISARPVLRAALTGVTAAVVGVIANLSVWFGLHVLFERIGTMRAGAVELALPDWASLDWRSALIVLVAALLLLRWHRGVPLTLAVCSACGIVLSTLGG
ncbi:chromate efflux transporter [Limimaricola sp. G21655-S1]|uniref:chromate efflux transporter n=1 Tax=Limimaricola sp. G21655-S1 TaxID=3014768 RepID=UPI0022AFF871|nr:chromate efflux transporter [Limimaricola sp. G21655-S1]MCZ4259559.1 chromate efflux transporter [Limimaricola sp. G21655-S1]